MSLRLVFMGTPAFAVPTLAALMGSGHTVAAVYTRAPRPAGRGLAPTPSPVERLAHDAGLPVETPRTLRDPDAAGRLASFRPDAVVVVAYGLILPRPVLDVAPLGCLNLHASLLPRWRGAAPIQRAVMAGDRETGVMAMRMEEGLDTGPVAAAESMPIPPDATAQEIHDRLAPLGADLIARALGALERGTLHFTPQPAEGVTTAAKIDKAETRIDWSRPAAAVHDHIRGLSPFPGAWFTFNGERIKVMRSAAAEGEAEPGTVLDGTLRIACGGGAVRLLALQRAGRQAMDAPTLLRGLAIPPGSRLG